MRIIVITGPTATGKTEIGIKLAEKINGEIVSADSMMVYKYMDIGTAKPSKEERGKIPHYLIDEVLPDYKFSVKDFLALADNYIESIIKRGKVPIVVGGTWLYIQALLYGLSDAPPTDWGLRKELYKKSNEFLYEELKKIDLDYAKKVHKNDKKRLIRGLEVFFLTGKPFSWFIRKHDFKQNRYEFIGFILSRERQEIMKRIELRVDNMLKSGLIKEVENLIIMGYEQAITSMQAIGYKELIPFLKGRKSLEEAKKEIIDNTKDFAKRQIRTFRTKFNGYNWRNINISNYTSNELLDTIIEKYNMEDDNEHPG